MSQENVEILRRFFDAMNRQDYKAAFAEAHPEVEIQDHPGVDAGGWNYGPEGAWQWGAKLAQVFEDLRFHTEAHLPLDEDSFLAFGSASGKGVRSGVAVSLTFAAVITIQDGLAKRIAVYETKAKALRGAADLLEAVGLREEDLKSAE